MIDRAEPSFVQARPPDLQEPATVTAVLGEHWQILRRRRALVAGVVLACVIVAVVASLSGGRVYEGTSLVRITQTAEDTVFGQTFSEPAANRARDVVSEIDVLRSPALQRTVESKLGDAAADFHSVSVRATPFSDVIEISTRASSAEVAADAANVYAVTFVEQRRAESVALLEAKAARLREQAAAANAQQAADTPPAVRQSLAQQATDFSRRADEIDIEAGLRRGRVGVVSEAAADGDPVAPRPVRTGLIALVLGILVAVGLAVAVDAFDDTLRSTAQLRQADPALRLLGVVPASPAGHGHVVGDEGAVAEAYRHLRTVVQPAAGEGPRTLMLTGARPGEDTAAIATNLALSLAQAGTTVALVDADVREPGVHRLLGLPNEFGLTAVLSGRKRLSTVAQRPTGGLTVVTAGDAADPEILASDRMAKVIQQLSTATEMVVVEAPPVYPLADAMIVGGVVDGAIIVVPIGRGTRRQLREARRRLEGARVPVLGVIGAETRP